MKYFLNVFFSLFCGITIGQSIITSSITQDYTPIEVSPLVNDDFKRLFKNDLILTEFFQIIGEKGEIKFNKAVMYASVGLENEQVEGGLDLKVIKVFTGYEGASNRRYVGLGGSIGPIDVELEIDFIPGMLAITSATIGVHDYNAPVKLTIKEKINNDILFQHEWLFENGALANWVTNRNTIPNLEDFVQAYIHKYYSNASIGEFKLKNSYVQLNESPNKGIVLDISLVLDNVTQAERYQRVVFLVHQLRKFNIYSRNINDWYISDNLSIYGELSKVSFHPSKVGDVMLTIDHDGMRGSVYGGYKIIKFIPRFIENEYCFFPVVINEGNYSNSMEKGSPEYTLTAVQEGLKLEKSTSDELKTNVFDYFGNELSSTTNSLTNENLTDETRQLEQTVKKYYKWRYEIGSDGTRDDMRDLGIFTEHFLTSNRNTFSMGCAFCNQDMIQAFLIAPSKLSGDSAIVKTAFCWQKNEGNDSNFDLKDILLKSECDCKNESNSNQSVKLKKVEGIWYIDEILFN